MLIAHTNFGTSGNDEFPETGNDNGSRSDRYHHNNEDDDVDDDDDDDQSPFLGDAASFVHSLGNIVSISDCGARHRHRLRGSGAFVRGWEGGRSK